MIPVGSEMVSVVVAGFAEVTTEDTAVSLDPDDLSLEDDLHPEGNSGILQQLQ